VTFKVGDKVRKNPAAWASNEFDAWGRGEGVGEVVGVTWPDFIDVRWPNGRCYEPVEGLELVADA